MTVSIVEFCEQRLRDQASAGWETLSESPLVVAPAISGRGFRSNVLLFVPENRASELPKPLTLDVVVADNDAPLAEGAVRHQVLLTHAEGVPILQEMLVTIDNGTTVQVISSATPADVEVCAPILADLKAWIEGGSDD